MRVFALILAATPVFAEPVVPQFVAETGSGLVHEFTGDWEQIVGGGVASFDCSGDDLPDLVLAGGTSKAALFVNQSTPEALKFVKTDSGLELGGVSATYPLDIDSDGIMDMVLLRVGENVVMRGLGACRFERANEAWGFDGDDAWSVAFSAMWETGASLPTLAIGNYIDRTKDAFPWGSCTDNWLHRPEGGHYAAPVALTPSYCALSMLFTDWNNSGQKALRVANDREYYKGGQEQMWHITPGEPARLYTKDEGWQRLRIWGMGIATTDLTGDGFPEYFLTSMADNKLQSLADPAGGKPVFKDLAFPMGLTAQRPYTGGDVHPSTAWHAQFEDVNNDGLADLFIAKGNVTEMPDFALKDPNNLLLQGADGNFVEAGDRAGVASMLVARGAMVTNLNGDGALDLVVVNRNAPAEIWRNTGAGLGHWLAIRLHEDGVNTDGIGAFIEVKTDHVQRREITSGGGHASGQNGFWHFGLGAAGAADVRVIWPDGTVGDWQSYRADEKLTISRD
ncbi:MAG: CRTAC1 family protein [Deltaproteobacteria bacterium]